MPHNKKNRLRYPGKILANFSLRVTFGSHIEHCAMTKSWGIKKGQILAHPTAYNVFTSEYLEVRCRAHSSGLWPPPCQAAFGRLLGAAHLEKRGNLTKKWKKITVLDLFSE